MKDERKNQNERGKILLGQCFRQHKQTGKIAGETFENDKSIKQKMEK